MIVSDTDMKIDARPKRLGWAPGGYFNMKGCDTCGKPFIGDKRAGMCSDCAYSNKPYGDTPQQPERK